MQPLRAGEAGGVGWGWDGGGAVCQVMHETSEQTGCFLSAHFTEDLRTKQCFNIKTVIIREWKCGIQADLKITEQTSKKCACGQIFRRCPGPQESVFILLHWEGYFGVKV